MSKEVKIMIGNPTETQASGNSLTPGPTAKEPAENQTRPFLIVWGRQHLKPLRGYKEEDRQ